MAYYNDDVFDNGLSELSTYGNVLHICSQEPATYTEASSTYTLGNKTSLSVAAPTDRAGGGREVVVAAITDGSVTGTDTATHQAIVDTSGSRLLETGALSASQGVTSGNTFTLTSFGCGFGDPS